VAKKQRKVGLEGENMRKKMKNRKGEKGLNGREKLKKGL